MHERIQYVGRQFLSEMGLNQMRSLEFWGMLVFMLLAWWVRLYLHYIAQYGFLRAARLPINRYNDVLLIKCAISNDLYICTHVYIPFVLVHVAAMGNY